MAKFDMIANHKRGFTNSTLGNAFRGGLTGALLFGGIAAIATLATGGLALPLVFGAAALGGAAFGTLNAVGGAVRWGVEAIGGILGMNRKQRGPQQGADEFGLEPQQQQGMGLAEALTAAVGTAIGIKGMKNKLSNAFGKADGKSEEMDFGRDATRSRRSRGGAPSVPSLLESRSFVNEAGDVQFRLTREDLANPTMREAVANFGKAQIQYRNDLHKHGGLEGKRTALEMQRAAMSVGADGRPDDALKPTFDRDSGEFVVRAEHLMNPDTQYAMVSEGRKHERSVAERMRQEERELNRELRALSEQPLIRTSQDPFRSASPAPAEPTLDEALAGREDTPATKALAENIRAQAQGAAAKLADSGAQHVGGADKARAGTATTAQERSNGQGRTA